MPWIDYGQVRLRLVGCLGSEPRLAVANWMYATFGRRFGEAAVPGGGECRPCPDFASYTLTFALQLKKIMEKLNPQLGKVPIFVQVSAGSSVLSLVVWRSW